MPFVHRTEKLRELAIIRALRAMNVSIPELSIILELRCSGVCNCSVLKDSIAAKMTSIDQRISELSTMKDELACRLDSLQDWGAPSGNASSVQPLQRWVRWSPCAISP